MNRRSLTSAIVAGLLLPAALWPAPAGAQSYPNKPIKLIVPFPAGGPADLFARVLGNGLTAELGQQIVIENRAGVGGMAGVDALAKSAPDGYTIGMNGAAALSAIPFMVSKMPFDWQKDLALLTLVVRVPEVLVVHPSVSANTLQDLVAYAHANPKKINFGSAGTGTITHLAVELLKTEAKIDLVHVPYKGAAPALQDVIAGHVQMMFATASSVVPHIRDDKVRALGVATLKRTAVLPEIPTIDELGIKGFDATTWHGLVVPARTPKEIVATLHRALATTLEDAAVKKSLGDLGVDIITGTPEDFAAYIKSEIPKWTAIIKASGAKLD